MAGKFDWEMRGIFRTQRMDPKKAFRRDWLDWEEEEALSDTDTLYNEIQFLLDIGEYCQAEDLLFLRLDEKNLRHLEIGLSFFQQLEDCSDADLEAHDFSREEVQRGLLDLCKRFGLPMVVE